jgi:viologen exporter family transport system permease protein
MPRRYAARLVWHMMRTQLMTELQYRANVVMHVYQSVLAIGLALVTLSLVFGQVTELNGWHRADLLILLGEFTLVGGLLRVVVRPNLGQLAADVRQGTLDHALLKPVDTLLLVSTRRLEIWQGVDVLTGLGVVVWGITEVRGDIGVAEALLFAGTFLCGLIIVYCFLFSLITTAFWLVSVNELVEMFESVYQAGRWPLSIYPEWMRFGLTFMVPISFALTVPVEALTARASAGLLVVEFVMAIVFVVFTRWFFRFALRHYTGASA